MVTVKPSGIQKLVLFIINKEPMKHFVWGEWRSDEELEEIAREMNRISRRIERKTRGVAEWSKEVQKANQKRGGKAF